MAERMQAVLVNDALMMAVWKRKPAQGLIWHTDRSSQYASDSHRRLLAQHGILQSMSCKGDCWDNAVAESFFHSLKTELVHHETYPTRAAAKRLGHNAILDSACCSRKFALFGRFVQQSQ